MRTSNSGIYAVDQKTTTLIREVPKVELHLHLEGSMPIPLIKRLAARYQLTLDLEFAKDDTRIMWRDFADFLLKYDEASRVICCKEALEEITYEYLKCCHEQGCIYNELTVSPDHLARYGMSYDTVLSSVEAGIAKAKAERNGSLTLGRAIAACFDDGNQSDQAKARLRRLLACDELPELCRILRPLLSLVASRVSQPLDYTRLLKQLRRFGYADAQQAVKAQWAQEFYAHKVETEAEA